MTLFCYWIKFNFFFYVSLPWSYPSFLVWNIRILLFFFQFIFLIFVIFLYVLMLVLLLLVVVIDRFWLFLMYFSTSWVFATTHTPKLTSPLPSSFLLIVSKYKSCLNFTTSVEERTFFRIMKTISQRFCSFVKEIVLCHYLLKNLCYSVMCRNVGLSIFVETLFSIHITMSCLDLLRNIDWLNSGSSLRINMRTIYKEQVTIYFIARANLMKGIKEWNKMLYSHVPYHNDTIIKMHAGITDVMIKTQ